MSDYVRLLFEAARMIGEAITAVAPARATVRVPVGMTPARARVVTERLTGPILLRAGELGTSRPVFPKTEHAPPDDRRVVVLLGGRPLAVVPLDESGDLPDDAVDLVDRAVRRRLSVLVDTASVVEQVAGPDPALRRLVAGALAGMVDNGVAPGRADPGVLADLAETVPMLAVDELTELLVNRFAPDVVTVEVPDDVLRAAPAETTAMVDARANLFATTGLQFPDLRLRPATAASGTIRIGINDVTVEHRLPAGAGWDDVVATVYGALADAAPWFVRCSAVEHQLELLREAAPDLVDLTLRCYSVPLLAGCLREMLRHGDSVRNLPRILWLLLDVGSDVADDVPADRISISEPLLLAGPRCSSRIVSEPVHIAARVRRVAAEDLRATAAEEPLEIPLDVERRLLTSTGDDLAAAERAVLDTVPVSGRRLRVRVGSVEALAPVRHVLQSLPTVPRVVCAQEVGISAAGYLPDQVYL